MSHQFKTEEFLKLFNEWNKKLLDSGHKEVEDFSRKEPPLKQWSNLNYAITYEKYTERIDYGDKASEFLERHIFTDPIHKEIWALHVEGFYIREIARRINRRCYKKSKIHQIIQSLKRIMLDGF